jgi:hypothetical protein
MIGHDDVGFMLWFTAIVALAILGVVVLSTLVLP